MFKEDTVTEDHQDNENSNKSLKDELNNHIKDEYGKENTETKPGDGHTRSDSIVNLPFIDSDAHFIPYSSSKGRATSPASLSSSFKVLPPIKNIVEVCYILTILLLSSPSSNGTRRSVFYTWCF